MPKVICTICKATGFSKCPHCRTVFQDNEADALLSHIYKFDIIKTKTDSGRTISTFQLSIDEAFLRSDELLDTEDFNRPTDHEMILRAFKRIARDFHAMSQSDGIIDPKEPWKYPTLEQYSCYHRFELAPGEESSIGCGHKGPAIEPTIKSDI